MILYNIFGEGENTAPVDTDPLQGGIEIDCGGALAFGGLINSHDHLEFNLFPRLGNPPYANYRQWGRHIHVKFKDTIEQVQRVPLALRVQWGMYRNLLNGFSTVVHHGKTVPLADSPVRVVQDNTDLHSPGFEQGWKRKLNSLGGRIVIHAGEGTDSIAREEVRSLVRWNLFRKKIIAVHGVAMSAEMAAAFEALVWCPSSNYFMFGETAPVDQLSKNTTILFGTDSALTAEGTHWDQLRLARSTGLLSNTGLYSTITSGARNVWNVANVGNFVVARRKEVSFMDSFFSTTPADILLVIHANRVVLYDETFASKLPSMPGFWPVNVGSSVKYVPGNVPALVRRIRSYYPAVRFPLLENAGHYAAVH